MVNVCGGTGNCVGDGILVFQRWFRFADITDRLSETFLVGERRTKGYPSTWIGIFAGAMHAPGRVVAVASTPPNSSQGRPDEGVSRPVIGPKAHALYPDNA
jgi:hypothetical protein